MPLQDWQGNWLKEVAAQQIANTAQPDPPITSDLGQRVLLVRLASCCADLQGEAHEDVSNVRSRALATGIAHLQMSWLSFKASSACVLQGHCQRPRGEAREAPLSWC